MKWMMRFGEFYIWLGVLWILVFTILIIKEKLDG